MSSETPNTKAKAIALCRVSSDEQLKNNSLARQNEAVMNTAKRLGAFVPDHYVWSGSVSSKRGKNVDRKDLKEMLEACKKDGLIKYLIVDEPDRFMRSIEEAFYWETSFEQVGVRVMYTDEELNTDDASGKLLRFLKYFQAEGSNEERIKKAISGHEKAIRDGRYTFHPPIGYMRGQIAGIHEIDPNYGPYLKQALESIADGSMTVKQAMNWYNENCLDIKLGKHCKVKLDKWRKWVVNPYYAGIVEMNKQVKAKNEHGLHERLITKEQHELIVEAVEGHKKLHKGPRKGGNPRFPLNQILMCGECQKAGRICKFTGYDNKNGKTNKVYSRYFCRGCNKALSRDEVHAQISNLIERLDFSDDGRKAVLLALNKIWTNEEKGLKLQKELYEHNLTELREKKQKILDRLVEETNQDIKDGLRDYLVRVERELKEQELKTEGVVKELEAGRKDFLDFALGFIDHMGEHFLELPLEEVGVCKNILFLGGFWMDANKRIYTLEVSPLYRERTLKMGINSLKNALMVGREGLEPPTSSV